jgi:hypothetical protein
MAPYNIETSVASYISLGEVYQDREPNAVEKVGDFLASYGVSVKDVQALPSSERPAFLIDKLLTRSDIEAYATRHEDDSFVPSDVGLIVAKPELHAHLPRIEAFLADMGIESKSLPTVNISKEEWLAMYGYKISDSPDIINLYITQRALGMTPIVFRHLTREAYLDYAARFEIDTGEISNPDDLMEVFDKILCGSSDRQSNGTLRWDITRSSLESSGFHHFSGEDEAFDLYNFYREGHENYVYKVFNGMHLPANGVELQRNLDIFLK